MVKRVLGSPFVRSLPREWPSPFGIAATCEASMSTIKTIETNE